MPSFLILIIAITCNIGDPVVEMNQIVKAVAKKGSRYALAEYARHEIANLIKDQPEEIQNKEKYIYYIQSEKNNEYKYLIISLITVFIIIMIICIGLVWRKSARRVPKREVFSGEKPLEAATSVSK